MVRVRCQISLLSICKERLISVAFSLVIWWTAEVLSPPVFPEFTFGLAFMISPQHMQPPPQVLPVLLNTWTGNSTLPNPNKALTSGGRVLTSCVWKRKNIQPGLTVQVQTRQKLKLKMCSLATQGRENCEWNYPVFFLSHHIMTVTAFHSITCVKHVESLAVLVQSCLPLFWNTHQIFTMYSH